MSALPADWSPRDASGLTCHSCEWYLEEYDRSDLELYTFKAIDAGIHVVPRLGVRYRARTEQEPAGQ